MVAAALRDLNAGVTLFNIDQNSTTLKKDGELDMVVSTLAAAKLLIIGGYFASKINFTFFVLPACFTFADAFLHSIDKVAKKTPEEFKSAPEWFKTCISISASVHEKIYPYLNEGIDALHITALVAAAFFGHAVTATIGLSILSLSLLKKHNLLPKEIDIVFDKLSLLLPALSLFFSNLSFIEYVASIFTVLDCIINLFIPSAELEYEAIDPLPPHTINSSLTLSASTSPLDDLDHLKLNKSSVFSKEVAILPLDMRADLEKTSLTKLAEDLEAKIITHTKAPIHEEIHRIAAEKTEIPEWLNTLLCKFPTDAPAETLVPFFEEIEHTIAEASVEVASATSGLKRKVPLWLANLFPADKLTTSCRAEIFFTPEEYSGFQNIMAFCKRGTIQDRIPGDHTYFEMMLKALLSSLVEGDDWIAKTKELARLGENCSQGWLRETSSLLTPATKSFSWHAHYKLAKVRDALLLETLHEIAKENPSLSSLLSALEGGVHDTHLFSVISMILRPSFRSYVGEHRWQQEKTKSSSDILVNMLMKYENHQYQKLLQTLALIFEYPYFLLAKSETCTRLLDEPLEKYTELLVIDSILQAVNPDKDTDYREIPWNLTTDLLLKIRDETGAAITSEDSYAWNPTLVIDDSLTGGKQRLTREGAKLLLWHLNILEKNTAPVPESP